MQRLFEHRINGEAKAKEDVTMEKLKEGAVKKVAAIKMGKTLLEFLKEVGVEVCQTLGSRLWVVYNCSMIEKLFWNEFSEILTFRSKRFL